MRIHVFFLKHIQLFINKQTVACTKESSAADIKYMNSLVWAIRRYTLGK